MHLDSKGIDITSQQDIEYSPQDCKILEGNLPIDAGFSGPFHPMDLVTITGGINVTGGDSIGITSFKMSTLEEVESIVFNSLPKLTEWSTPKLRSADIELGVPSEIKNIEFPALEESTAIRVIANASKISFPKLTEVDGPFLATNLEHSNSTSLTTVEISAPKLEHASQIIGTRKC
ncbi:hypothetical protein BJY04DRAFT_217855 [Aspergillus karnatakaensis]|uniref:uncharacterized protein n=1 Tax=Aspergillus karnatakaensis TaxID=1810916 RepID=UPI003CCD3F05